MAFQTTAEHTHTFAELRRWVLAEAKAGNHFAFRDFGEKYANFWEELNDAEFRRGYVPGEYEKPNTPALYEMKLLTEKEFSTWQETFTLFHGPRST